MKRTLFFGCFLALTFNLNAQMNAEINLSESIDYESGYYFIDVNGLAILQSDRILFKIFEDYSVALPILKEFDAENKLYIDSRLFISSNNSFHRSLFFDNSRIEELIQKIEIRTIENTDLQAIIWAVFIRYAMMEPYKNSYHIPEVYLSYSIWNFYFGNDIWELFYMGNDESFENCNKLFTPVSEFFPISIDGMFTGELVSVEPCLIDLMLKRFSENEKMVTDLPHAITDEAYFLYEQLLLCKTGSIKIWVCNERY